ncbi:S1 family peptidase [Aeromicrobium sp. CTD01-1L150]|uniref:S1 family peptidase n=1 Tax=Aeromicrobium sp. CTD01-1L150 TaxID=3341830 RepID=UPI0035BFFDE1
MATRKLNVFGSVAAVAVIATLAGQQATASASPDSVDDKAEQSMVAAMERDLGLDTAEVKERILDESVAAQAQDALSSVLGSEYAGSWFDADAGTLVVAVTDAEAADAVRAEGAQPQQVERSGADLQAYADKLDAAKADAPGSVASWYVDAESNSVVVATREDAAAESFVAEAGVPAGAVTIKETPEKPQPLAQGGDAYYIGTARCSIGFAVDGGFVTAGHCGTEGSSTTQPTGVFEGSSFPGDDYAFVSTSTQIDGTVNDYDGGSVSVGGSDEAPIGSSICRSGSTTGWQCGEIEARGATVNYAEGTVTGLIRTSACAERGDSGGSAISGNQAQGVTSGGSGNCILGGTTYFQPVNEILSAYGLTLKTS